MSKPAIHYVLWTVQILLALLFLFTGIVKFTIPIQELSAQAKMPGILLRIVSVAEIAGAFGLVLPGLFRVRTGLTPLAASGLIIIMIGAVVSTVETMSVLYAVLPFATGLLLIFVVYGRTRVAPLA